MKKIINTLLLTFGLGLFGMLINSSCNDDDYIDQSGCGLPPRTLDSLSLKRMTINDESFVEEIDDIETFSGSFQELFYGIEAHSFEFPQHIQSFNLNLNTTSLYACSPLIYYGKIDSLIITSNTDYNDDYPANTSLSPIMNLVSEGVTAEALNGEIFHENTILMHLNEAPSINSDHTLTFTFHMQNAPEVSVEVDVHIKSNTISQN